MSQVKLTIIIDVPDGVQVQVGEGDPSVPAPIPGTTPQFVPQRVIAPQQAPPLCPTHGTSKFVPAGTSKRTGKPYEAFWSCTERECPWKV